MAMTELTETDDCSRMADFERMALNIGELEGLGAHPLLAEEAGSLRRLTSRLRSAMDAQFDMVAAGSTAFPWWRDRMRFGSRA